MYRVTVMVNGEGPSNLAAGLAEVQRKVEQGFTSSADGGTDGSYQFKVAALDPNDDRERQLADHLGVVDEAAAHGDLLGLANGMALYMRDDFLARANQKVVLEVVRRLIDMHDLYFCECDHGIALDRCELCYCCEECCECEPDDESFAFKDEADPEKDDQC
jgi:hypothetical protein